MANNVVTQPSNYFDLQGLDQLRQKAQGNSKESIREVANQFESMFASMLIKSMRQANEAFETDSPFNNKDTKFYTDMQDKQLALDISRHGSLGLADALVRQLDPMSISRPQGVPEDKLLMPNSDKGKMMDINKTLPPVDLNKPDQTQPSVMVFDKTKQSTNDAKPFTDQKSFIETLMPYAKKVAKTLGISPAALVAQSALETGWGKKIINGSDNQSSFNLFNIKAHKDWQGDKVAKDSLEVEDGIGIKRRSDFRAYQDYAQSFTDYGKFITTNQRYKEALDQGTDAGRYVEELQKAGYATDPQYADKIKQIMNNESFKAAVAEGESNG
ncbi:flagellar assembly peptidoglycan hydrolase FlgJ [Psychromonas sp. Urea-02u-13]|uniref:flagellar assembly peptidoglycan hydrolase FlgJ n=1 Tax=Psychromonas sp. Urea-02u-13 TaxID=2058326 RepID=UPI000C3351D6|nr:flagellar assembly peptidoglycan hydrolase FlgJ [Psychromonas sp. Urea-02u-13]PKG38627.1 flagellar assembly peptidoglycan hydrolase FlgJ [Psychromonas sp. Urea-02u-13]